MFTCIATSCLAHQQVSQGGAAANQKGVVAQLPPTTQQPTDSAGQCYGPRQHRRHTVNVPLPYHHIHSAARPTHTWLRVAFVLLSALHLDSATTTESAAGGTSKSMSDLLMQLGAPVPSATMGDNQGCL